MDEGDGAGESGTADDRVDVYEGDGECNTMIEEVDVNEGGGDGNGGMSYGWRYAPAVMV